MPRFLHQISYTSEALARLIANPQDRFEVVRGPIEKLGGKIEHGYFAFGEHDAVLITEMPDNVSAAAIALAFAAGGALKNCATTPLLTRSIDIRPRPAFLARQFARDARLLHDVARYVVFLRDVVFRQTAETARFTQGTSLLEFSHVRRSPYCVAGEHSLASHQRSRPCQRPRSAHRRKWRA